MDKKFLVTADLGHFKAYRIEEDERFSKPRARLVETWSTPVTHRFAEDLTDQAGQFRKRTSPGGPNDRSDGEAHNLQLERRRRALKSLARRISQVLSREPERDLYLAAGKEINHAILEALDGRTRAKLQKNVELNLTNLDLDEVLAHFYTEKLNTEQSQGVPRSKNAQRKTSLVRKADYNRSNVRRKPNARRTSPFKKTMRKQTITPQLAEIMREQPDKGDRRRTVAQRKLKAHANQ